MCGQILLQTVREDVLSVVLLAPSPLGPTPHQHTHAPIYTTVHYISSSLDSPAVKMTRCMFLHVLQQTLPTHCGRMLLK